MRLRYLGIHPVTEVIEYLTDAAVGTVVVVRCEDDDTGATFVRYTSPGALSVRAS